MTKKTFYFEILGPIKIKNYKSFQWKSYKKRMHGISVSDIWSNIITQADLSHDRSPFGMMK